jgi:hypothetical protein
VAAHEIDLELGQPVARDRDVGQLPEPRRDAVGHLVPLDEGVNDAARGPHASRGGRRE